ncbi:MAG: bifunctional hydroxymethylpyrimidine kinase/phosphomethylpyrimidine kinase [Dysgonamonadaceae bacterium]|nr:bifunctional hydroxymethylpyrimidine kinase/phosphomethylpyrimidine kinase [Dysgonamonadaceae bacterium]
MRKNKVLLVSDFVGVGKVALSTMIPILNTMEANVSYLPTAVVSNNFDYGEAVVEELTDFMKNSKDLWKKLDFQFDIIYTGIIMNTDQVDTIKEIIQYHHKKPLIISDPIMGDDGELYPGLSKELIEASRLMALEADIIIPNLTEFCLIVGRDYLGPDKLEHSKIVAWLNKARGRGVKSAIITSVHIRDEYYVYGYSEKEDIFRVKVDYVPVHVGGAGDVFSSLIIGRYVKEPNLKKSIEYTTKVLTAIIRKEYQEGVKGKVNEIKIQNHLQDIYKSL